MDLIVKYICWKCKAEKVAIPGTQMRFYHGKDFAAHSCPECADEREFEVNLLIKENEKENDS